MLTKFNISAQRASVIMVVNVPSWFSMCFKIIKPFINENTQKKIKVYNAKDTFKGMCEFASPEDIPVEYGGTSKNVFSVVGDPGSSSSELEQAFYEYVEVSERSAGVADEDGNTRRREYEPLLN